MAGPVRFVRLLPFLAALVLPLLLLSAGTVSGVWNISTRSPEGDPFTGVVTVKQEGAAVSGNVSIPQGSYNMIEPKVSGQTLTFKLAVEDLDVTVEVKVDGDTLVGFWSSGTSRTPIKGTRKP